MRPCPQSTAWIATSSLPALLGLAFLVACHEEPVIGATRCSVDASRVPAWVLTASDGPWQATGASLEIEGRTHDFHRICGARPPRLREPAAARVTIGAVGLDSTLPVELTFDTTTEGTRGAWATWDASEVSGIPDGSRWTLDVDLSDGAFHGSLTEVGPSSGPDVDDGEVREVASW